MQGMCYDMDTIGRASVALALKPLDEDIPLTDRRRNGDEPARKGCGTKVQEKEMEIYTGRFSTAFAIATDNNLVSAFQLHSHVRYPDCL